MSKAIETLRAAIGTGNGPLDKLCLAAIAEYDDLAAKLAKIEPQPDQKCPDCDDGAYAGTDRICRTCSGLGLIMSSKSTHQPIKNPAAVAIQNTNVTADAGPEPFPLDSEREAVRDTSTVPAVQEGK